jgi:hypothetical protein
MISKFDIDDNVDVLFYFVSFARTFAFFLLYLLSSNNSLQTLFSDISAIGRQQNGLPPIHYTAENQAGKKRERIIPFCVHDERKKKSFSRFFSVYRKKKRLKKKISFFSSLILSLVLSSLFL